MSAIRSGALAVRTGRLYRVVPVALTLLTTLARAGVAQTGTVVGTVVDRATSQPLEGSAVQVMGTRLGVATDAKGHFLIRGVAVGSATVRVQRLGFRPASQIVTVAANDSVAARFVLDASAVDLEAVVTTGTG